MLSAWFPLVLAVAVLASIPFGLKWLQRRMGVGAVGGVVSAKVISAVAVGPHQRVVTVEVGPLDARVWLTLGVTAQAITCLHTSAAGSGSADAAHAPDPSVIQVRE
ncbi:flagellar biosynthetic protein FliO [Rhodoferax sp. BLA1]|uniref:FliO/MopB family protein n=1 Tax=Rhodoferax sp. BLA1 TaxID=2576062 RepID=UPI0015D24887|nr:flagellar biosynthetic protein FliO [Rhodoferax sp. BLA1]